MPNLMYQLSRKFWDPPSYILKCLKIDALLEVKHRLQEVPAFRDFWHQKVSRNSGITNFETLFSTKSQIGSKIFQKSTFLANFLGNFFLKFQIFDFSFAYFSNLHIYYLKLMRSSISRVSNSTDFQSCTVFQNLKSVQFF